MSREMNLVPISESDLRIGNRIRLVAATLTVAFFGGLMALAPEEPGSTNTHSVAAVNAGVERLVSD